MKCGGSPGCTCVPTQLAGIILGNVPNDLEHHALAAIVLDKQFHGLGQRRGQVLEMPQTLNNLQTAREGVTIATVEYAKNLKRSHIKSFVVLQKKAVVSNKRTLKNEEDPPFHLVEITKPSGVN